MHTILLIAGPTPAGKRLVLGLAIFFLLIWYNIATNIEKEGYRMALNVQLLPLADSDREQFILDNQEAFRYGAMEEFGMRDNHFEEEGEIISRSTIETSIFM